MRRPLAQLAMPLIAAAVLAGPAQAMDELFWSRTRLVNLSDQLPLSSVARDLSRGGYQLADGRPVRFHDWYSPSTIRLQAEWSTEIGPNLDLLWGVSTGESGQKYRIAPAVSLGFNYAAPVGQNAALSIAARTWIGGHFTEQPCTADYGAIGGTQQVNCRLAASHMAPSETLRYLAQKTPTRLNLRVSYRMQF